MSSTTTRRGGGETLLLALAAAAAAACGGGSKEPEAPVWKQQISTHHTTAAAGTVTLRDRLGNPIPVGSTTPYSPEQTCGTAACHDYQTVTQGYHFQQGYGRSNGFLPPGRKTTGSPESASFSIDWPPTPVAWNTRQS